MAYEPPPTINCSQEITQAFGDHKGQPCVIMLELKYKHEKHWLRERIWMQPGWEQIDIYLKAYKWIREDCEKLYYKPADVEKSSFISFKLV